MKRLAEGIVCFNRLHEESYSITSLFTKHMDSTPTGIFLLIKETLEKHHEECKINWPTN
uniref:Uncharacterized protein n=1 Tax=Arundo donax TaxID=35708 RepID=A0A0A9U4Z8_ARUDO